MQNEEEQIAKLLQIVQDQNQLAQEQNQFIEKLNQELNQATQEADSATDRFRLIAWLAMVGWALAVIAIATALKGGC